MVGALLMEPEWRLIVSETAKKWEVQSCWPSSPLSYEREWTCHPGLCDTKEKAEAESRKIGRRSKFYGAMFRVVEIDAIPVQVGSCWIWGAVPGNR